MFSENQIRLVFDDDFGIISHIHFGLCVRPCIHLFVTHFLMHAISYEPCVLGFWNYVPQTQGDLGHIVFVWIL